MVNLLGGSEIFYKGQLNEFEASININPSSVLNFDVIGTHNIGRLPFGDFDQTLLGVRVRFNVTPDLQLNSFCPSMIRIPTS